MKKILILALFLFASCYRDKEDVKINTYTPKTDYFYLRYDTEPLNFNAEPLTEKYFKDIITLPGGIQSEIIKEEKIKKELQQECGTTDTLFRYILITHYETNTVIIISK